MLSRRQVLLDAKMMDEQFFMYLEDADLCRRIRQLGWQVRYTPEAEVVHFGGGSVRSNVERSALEYRRSQLYYFQKAPGRKKSQGIKNLSGFQDKRKNPSGEFQAVDWLGRSGSTCGAETVFSGNSFPDTAFSIKDGP